jgi:V-type H+-transporting ATPase subunit C
MNVEFSSVCCLLIEFLNAYETIGDSIAAFGGPDWTNSSAVGSNDGKFGKGLKRTSNTGSPVVPKSGKKVTEEGESVMYAITVLRGHYVAGYYQDDVFTPGKDMILRLSGNINLLLCLHSGTFVEYLDPIKAAFREKRFTVRELVYDSAKTGGVDGLIKQATEELKQVKATVLRWCKAHFGEVFSGWIHLKVIQAFVESVLRYGLPVDFVPIFIEVDNKVEKEVKLQLTRSILNLRPELRPKKTLVDEEEGENPDGETLPFVCLKFPIIGATTTAV